LICGNLKGLVSYDPILLKKIAQVYIEKGAVFMLALESGADLATGEWRSIVEEPQVPGADERIRSRRRAGRLARRG
jgi:hypothetical protein